MRAWLNRRGSRWWWPGSTTPLQSCRASCAPRAQCQSRQSALAEPRRCRAKLRWPLRSMWSPRRLPSSSPLQKIKSVVFSLLGVKIWTAQTRDRWIPRRCRAHRCWRSCQSRRMAFFSSLFPQDAAPRAGSEPRNVGVFGSGVRPESGFRCAGGQVEEAVAARSSQGVCPCGAAGRGKQAGRRGEAVERRWHAVARGQRQDSPCVRARATFG